MFIKDGIARCGYCLRSYCERQCDKQLVSGELVQLLRDKGKEIAGERKIPFPPNGRLKYPK